MRLVQVYLHTDQHHGEIEECYDVSHEDADTIYNLLYEVPLFIDLDSKEIVALNGRKISEEIVHIDD
jgi:hypothetical protein